MRIIHKTVLTTTIVLMVVSALGGALVDVNLLKNHSFDSGLTNWTSQWAGIRNNDPLPCDGPAYLMGGQKSFSDTWQSVDLSAAGFTNTEVDSETLYVNFGGMQSGHLE